MSFLQLPPKDYHNLLHQAISDKGNIDRLQKAIEKAKTETVNLAFLGGSITAGYIPQGEISEKFVSLFSRYFSEKYCGKKGVKVDTALCTVGAIMGLAQAEGRLRAAKLDIIFVELAINNGLDKLQIAYFESLIDKILNFESKPAVVLIIVCNQDFYTCSSYMELIAEHYDLPVANVYKVLKAGIENHLFEWKDYACDGAHPIEEGHQLIADCLIHLFERLERRESTVYQIPPGACFTREFSSYEFCDHNSGLPMEGNCFQPGSTNAEFPSGWCYTKGNGNKAFSMTLSLKNLFILYELSNSMDYGEIEVFDNGKVIVRIEGYSILGWNNPYAKLVINETDTQLHRITIRMRQGDENKKFFLLGFGIIR